MLRSGALRSTDSELVQACIKGLTSLFNLHNSKIAERTGQREARRESKALREINSINPHGKIKTLNILKRTHIMSIYVQEIFDFR